MNRAMHGVPYSEKTRPRQPEFRSFTRRKACGLAFVFFGTVSRVNEIGFLYVSLTDDP